MLGFPSAVTDTIALSCPASQPIYPEFFMGDLDVHSPNLAAAVWHVFFAARRWVGETS
jgi:hypothetical protein